LSDDHQLFVTVPAALIEAIAARAAELTCERREREARSSPWLDVERAAAYLGLSRDSLYKLIAARAIPVRKRVGGQRLLFHRAELDQWLEHTYRRQDRT
jgi:excisionase family DNA binding protein